MNDLAPDHLRGPLQRRDSAAFQLGAIVAPPIAGLLIGHGLSEVYIGTLVAGLAGRAWSPSSAWSHC